MPYIEKPGITGLIYVPEERNRKKNSCPDCAACNWCSDERCSMCLAHSRKCSKKDEKKDETCTDTQSYTPQ